MVGHAGTIGGNRSAGELLDALIALADLVKDDKALKALRKETADNLAAAERAGVGTSLSEARNTARQLMDAAKAKQAEADDYYKSRKDEANALLKEFESLERAARKERDATDKRLAARENAVASREADLAKALADLESRRKEIDERTAALDARRDELEAWAERMRKATAR